jgi:hypothetical protein
MVEGYELLCCLKRIEQPPRCHGLRRSDQTLILTDFSRDTAAETSYDYHSGPREMKRDQTLPDGVIKTRRDSEC